MFKKAFTLTEVNAIVYDCSSLDYGIKLNAMWGEPNIDKRNIAYIITNGVATIRRIILGMGTNQLESGLYASGASDNEFNGTFVLSSYYS